MASIAFAARAYQRSFDARPSTTLALTNGTLFALGDAVAQLSQIMQAKSNEEKSYQPLRTLRFFTFGVGMGPLLGRWNRFLEQRFPLRAVGGSGKVSTTALCKRVAADQLVMAPIGLVLFLGSMGVMEGRDARHIQQKYIDLFEPAIRANWKVWPLAQFINFRFMPLPYRVPFQSTLGIFWNLYLSLLNSRENQAQLTADALRKTIA
ncbi:hypothetical protein BD410DRAFT_760321 [Rickenella mellea]|uniref:Uncharacterized protein n=1 Tax=Rickenella mellea TaxID=50990 RepID=A0A4Y7QNA8_9AGAM|nr:hypothetical protein BD410DRAFT_760321 [Rickenella mellea]